MILIGQLRAIRVLCEVDAQGSFSAAAQELGLSQSAVSQHIAALERHVGLTLVERGTRPVGLSEAGHSLARHGRSVITRLSNAEQELAEIAGRRHGRLRFGSFPTALATFVPPALARFRLQLPDTTITVVDDHLQRLLPRLGDGELDLALVYENEFLTETHAHDLERTYLFDDPFHVVLPERHQLAGSDKTLDLVALAEETWVGGLPGSAWFRIVRHACRAAGFDPRTSFASDDYVAVQAFAAAGLGVAVIPGLALARPMPGTRVRRLRQGGPVRRILAVRPRDAFHPASTGVMLDILESTTRPLRNDHYVRVSSPR